MFIQYLYAQKLILVHSEQCFRTHWVILYTRILWYLCLTFKIYARKSHRWINVEKWGGACAPSGPPKWRLCSIILSVCNIEVPPCSSSHVVPGPPSSNTQALSQNLQTVIQKYAIPFWTYSYSHSRFLQVHGCWTAVAWRWKGTAWGAIHH